MRSRGLSEPVVVVLASVALACLLTFPLIARFDHAGRVDNNDGRWSIWVVSWVAHSLTTDPLNTYQANIFYPHQDALTYSEANLVEGAIGAPMWLLTKNPYATHNFVVLVGLVVSAIGAFYFIRYLTGSGPAAAIAAALFAFCPFYFARSAHIQLQMIGGLPICMLAFHRLLDRSTPGRGVALGLALWLQGLACAYYGIFAGLMVGLGTIYFAISRKRWADRSYWVAIAVAAVICIGLTLPFFVPYLAMQKQTGFGRSLEDATRYSANFGAWFASSAWAHRWLLELGWVKGFSEVLFPGFMALTLGLAGVWLGLRRRQRDIPLFYGLTGVLAFWIALGPTCGLYLFLHTYVPLFSFLRAPARTGIVVTLCLVVLASITLQWLFERTRKKALLAAGLFVLAIGDDFQAPLRLRDAFPDNEAYSTLARLPRAPVAEFPYWANAQNFHGHSEYMLRSTAHWQPLINGYSDHIPQDFRDGAQVLRSFPSVESFKTLERYGARYVVLHLNLFGQETRDRLPALLDQDYQPYLRPLSKEGDIWLYEIIGWPR